MFYNLLTCYRSQVILQSNDSKLCFNWRCFTFREYESHDWSEYTIARQIFLVENVFCNKSEKYSWARPWENVFYAICEQQRRRSACASAQSDQRLCCSLPRQNDTSSLYIRNFKILAGLCSLAGQLVSCLVGDSRRHIFSWRGSIIYNTCWN